MQWHEDGTNFGLFPLYFSFNLFMSSREVQATFLPLTLPEGYLDTRKLYRHFDQQENARKQRCREASNRKCCIFVMYSFAVI